MTQTETLASLLRRAAEKWPEKFEQSANRDTCFRIRGEMFWYDAERLNLEEMDAIAAAVGMRFTVDMLPIGVYWYQTHQADATDVWHIVHTDPLNHETKRLASIAALCAVLEYALGETK